MNNSTYQLMFEAGRYALPENRKGLLCTVTWDEPYHSEFTYFHGIRLREPHTSVLGHARIYSDPILAMQKYLRVKWQGFDPSLTISAGLKDLLSWETPMKPAPITPDLPF